MQGAGRGQCKWKQGEGSRERGAGRGEQREGSREKWMKEPQTSPSPSMSHNSIVPSDLEGEFR